jgi:hypothetical protein
MKKTYRLYSFDPDGGENTKGYAKLTQEEKTEIEKLSDKQHPAYELMVEEVKVEVEFKEVKKELANRIKRENKMEKEKMEHPEYGKLYKALGEKTAKELEKYREKNKGREEELDYSRGIIAILSKHQTDASFIDLMYMSRSETVDVKD